MRTTVTDYLEKAGVSFRIREHRNPVFTSEEAARERGIRVSQIAKTMVAQDRSGGVIVAVVPGDRRLDLRRLRAIAGDPGIKLVPSVQVQERLGLTVGAISPVQLLDRGARFYMDQALLEEGMVDISSGIPEAGLELRPEDLRVLLEALVCEIGVSRSTPS